MNSFNEYLSEALGLLDEKYIDETLDVLSNDNLRKKNNKKKLLVLLVAVVAVRGVTKYVGTNHNLHLSKSNKGV